MNIYLWALIALLPCAKNKTNKNAPKKIGIDMIVAFFFSNIEVVINPFVTMHRFHTYRKIQKLCLDFAS